MKINFTVENYKEFLPLQDLYKRFEKIAGSENITEIGKSKNKEKIICAKLGSGKKNALVFGYPHPNEPVGSLACLSLVKILKEQPKLLKKFTWYIVPCADPDGAQLNEGWFKGKFTIKKYVYNFYRQMNDQTEWTFPVQYKKYSFNKPTVQTKVLKNLIDEIRPSLVYPLHNSGFSGAYFLLTKNLGGKYFDSIKETCKRLNIPMHLGGPEAPFIKLMHPSFFKEFGTKEVYDFFEKIKLDPLENMSGGASSIEYSKKYHKNVLGLVGEIPYITDSAISNTKTSNTSKKEVKLAENEAHSFAVDFILERITHKDINKKSVFYCMVKENIFELKNIIKTNTNIIGSLPSENCTHAEEFFSKVIVVFYRTLLLGEFRRLLLTSKQTKEIHKMVQETEYIIEEKIKFLNKNSNYKVLPIKSLVELQLMCLLNALD